MEDKTFRDSLTLNANYWRRTMNNFPTKTMWWERHVKTGIRQIFRKEGAIRNKERKDLENFYYAALYDAIRTPPTTENIATTIRRLTAKIRRLSDQQMRGVLIDTAENDAVLNEDITTYHYARSRKRSKARQVSQILDNHGNIQNDKSVIMNIFTTYLESKYRTINSEEICYKKMTACGMPKIPAEANTELELPITMEELRTAVNKGKCGKSPGPDGICHEYHKQMWNCCKEDLLDVINMFIDGAVTNDKKNMGIEYVCQKHATP